MRRSTLLSTLAVTAAVVGVVAVPASSAGLPGVVDYTIPAARDTEPVVLTGRDFGVDTNWSVPQNLTFLVPEKDLQCFVEAQDLACPDEHNHYVEPDIDTASFTAGKVEGTPTERLLGYRWNGKGFEQIPFQVDEVFTRYLNNNASGFGIYSGTDQHTTYAYDREGFRYSADNGVSSADPCTAKAASAEATDPVKGLDSNDELAFMASDAGPAAPAGAAVPSGIEGVKVVTLRDPTNPTAGFSYVYVMRAAATGPKPAFTFKNGYVTYQRHPDANHFAYSQSSYGDYGAAAKGYYCDADGQRRAQPRRHAEDRPAPPPRHGHDHDPPLQVPLRRPLADDVDPDRQARRAGRLRPGHRRPLEGARVRAGPGLADTVLRLRGGGHELGRLVDPAR